MIRSPFARISPAWVLLLATACSAPEDADSAAPPSVPAQASELVAADGSVDWNRYYTADETYAVMARWAEMFPDLTELYSIGQSYLGAELWVMEVTNESTGPASEKPALYLDGGLHSRELTSSSVAFYALGKLLLEYGDDPQITALLDSRAFYVRPKFNPDGSDLALLEDQSLRSTVHPVDNDGDGVVDDDPPQDLNGDGRITQIRIPDPDGPFTVDPNDSRIMVRRQAGDAGPFYRTQSEGIDDDGDGRFNEDGIGGLDMNRNFPRNWELEHIQGGAGEFPLSEPETYATVKFLTDNRNITSVVHGHTSGGFIYRLPSASAPSLFPTVDLALIVHLGEYYTETTGRPVRPSATHPTQHRYGTLMSWAFWDRGIIGWVPEYSPPNAWLTDYDGDGEISQAEALRFDDEELGGRYFVEWEAYEHPQLGPVEVGGWHALFWGQNPPAEFLENETRQQLPWIFYLAEQSPMIEVSEPTISPAGDGRYRVEVEVSNSGFLPTSLTERGAEGREGPGGVLQNQIVAPPVATLAIEDGEVVDGPARVTVGHLGGSNTIVETVTERSRTVSWTVEAAPGASIRVVVVSPTGGTVRTGPVTIE